MQVQQIDYAPQRPQERRRRSIRLIVWGMIVLAVVVVLIAVVPSACVRVEILYWQHRAMTYSPSADRVVFDDDTTAAAKLRAANPQLLTGRSGETVDLAKPWKELDALISSPGSAAIATLFLHSRRNRNGQERLVMVSATKMASWQIMLGSQTSPPTSSQRRVMIGAIVFVPGAVFSNPIAVDDGAAPPGPPFPILEGSHVVLYAGQADPKNESHFTIDGAVDDKPVILDGWLLPNDQVEIDQRDLPLTSPAPSSSAKSPPLAR